MPPGRIVHLAARVGNLVGIWRAPLVGASSTGQAPTSGALQRDFCNRRGARAYAANLSTNPCFTLRCQPHPRCSDNQGCSGRRLPIRGREGGLLTGSLHPAARVGNLGSGFDCHAAATVDSVLAGLRRQEFRSNHEWTGMNTNLRGWQRGWQLVQFVSCVYSCLFVVLHSD